MANPNDPQNPFTPGELPTPGKKLDINYKFRDLKVHSSDEWMAEATKKYRRVYDRYETTYMRAELSFFNKLFDEADWEGSFRLKCFFLNGSNKTELCNLEEKRKVSKEENVVYIRNAWGTAVAGTYWFRGDYLWEGYVDDVKVGESKFYVEDMGVAKEDENLFFDMSQSSYLRATGKAIMNQSKSI
jgi:hypothetical protein